MEFKKICKKCGNVFVSKAKNSIYCKRECFFKDRNTNEYILKDDYAIIIIKSKKYKNVEVLIDKEDIEKCNKFAWGVRFDKKINDFYISARTVSIHLHRLITNCPDEWKLTI